MPTQNVIPLTLVITAEAEVTHADTSKEQE